MAAQVRDAHRRAVLIDQRRIGDSVAWLEAQYRRWLRDRCLARDGQPRDPGIGTLD